MSTTIDEARVEACVGQVATDIGAALGAGLVAIGDGLGLYRAMADGLPGSAAEIAVRTRTKSRYRRSTAGGGVAAATV